MPRVRQGVQEPPLPAPAHQVRAPARGGLGRLPALREQGIQNKDRLTTTPESVSWNEENE